MVSKHSETGLLGAARFENVRQASAVSNDLEFIDAEKPAVGYVAMVPLKLNDGYGGEGRPGAILVELQDRR